MRQIDSGSRQRRESKLGGIRKRILLATIHQSGRCKERSIKEGMPPHHRPDGCLVDAPRKRLVADFDGFKDGVDETGDTAPQSACYTRGPPWGLLAIPILIVIEGLGNEGLSIKHDPSGRASLTSR